MSWRNLMLLQDSQIQNLSHLSALYTAAYSSSPFFIPIEYLASLPIEYLIVGGIARSYYSTVRNTNDVDILLQNEEEVEKFARLTAGTLKRVRKHAFTHGHVEVEVLTPSYLGIPQSIADYIFSNPSDFALESNGTSYGKLPPPEGIILMKLLAMESSPEKDKHAGDIAAIMKSQGPSLDYPKILELSQQISPNAPAFIQDTMDKLKREFDDFQ